MSTKQSQTKRRRKNTTKKCKQIFFDMNLQSLMKTLKLNKRGDQTNQLELLNSSSISLSSSVLFLYTHTARKHTTQQAKLWLQSFYDASLFSKWFLNFSTKLNLQTSKREPTNSETIEPKRESSRRRRENNHNIFAIVCLNVSFTPLSETHPNFIETAAKRDKTKSRVKFRTETAACIYFFLLVFVDFFLEYLRICNKN